MPRAADTKRKVRNLLDRYQRGPPAPRPPFEDALGDLLAAYAGEDPDTLISAMELQIMGLKDQAGE